LKRIDRIRIAYRLKGEVIEASEEDLQQLRVRWWRRWDEFNGNT